MRDNPVPILDMTISCDAPAGTDPAAAKSSCPLATTTTICTTTTAVALGGTGPALVVVFHCSSSSSSSWKRNHTRPPDNIIQINGFTGPHTHQSLVAYLYLSLQHGPWTSTTLFRCSLSGRTLSTLPLVALVGGERCTHDDFCRRSRSSSTSRDCGNKVAVSVATT